jgi:hypothetical protein
MESTHNEGVAVGSRMSRMSHGVGFGTMLAISCLISYWLITSILAREYSVSHDNDLLGGMWAVVATIFVFRHRALQSGRAAISRTLATFLSFAPCFLYFLIFPFQCLRDGRGYLDRHRHFGSDWPFRGHRYNGHYDCRSVCCCRNK